MNDIVKHVDQPDSFTFTPENQAAAKAVIAKFVFARRLRGWAATAD